VCGADATFSRITLVLIYAGFRLTCWLRRGRLDDASAEERAAASVDLGPASASVDLGRAAASADLGRVAASVDLGRAAASVVLGRAAASVDLGRAAASVDLGRFQDLDRSFTLTLVAVALMHMVLVHGRMSCAKTAEPIEMPLPGGRLTWAPKKNLVLDGIPIFPAERGPYEGRHLPANCIP